MITLEVLNRLENQPISKQVNSIAQLFLLLIAFVCVMQDGIFLKESKQGRLITNDVFDGRVFEPNNYSSLTGITALESFLMFLSYH